MKIYKSTLLLLFVLSTYIVTAQCSTITTPDFGNNTWVVRVYNTKNLANIANSNYYGYYTQKLDITQNYGVKTTLQWPATNTGKPSAATAFNNTAGNGTAYSGCALTTQDFSFVHKRRGFPAGQYEIYVDVWDDKTEIYLNSQLVIEMANYGSNTHAPKCIYLDANSNLEVRTDNRGGSMSELGMRILRTTVASTISPNPITICQSERAVLTASASQVSTITNSTNSIANELTNVVWSGGPIVSGQNTAQVNVNPMTNTLYTYTATFKNCTFSSTALVTVQPPIGDPSVFGDNTWNVYGYNAGTSTNNLSSLNYYGYYTQNIDSNTEYGFNTNDITNDGWALNSNPSTSSSWNGCQLKDNNSYTYVHKRKGFPCGSYNLTMEKWDSNTRIYVNGTQIHSSTNTCTSANCTETPFSSQQLLDANSTIEIRTNELGGNSWAKLKIEPIRTTTLANNNDVKTCPVKGNQWVDFYSHPDGRYLASVRGVTPTSDLGKVTVTTYVDATNQMALACDNIDHITAVMQRHWLIDATINGQAEVRLPYKDQEFLNLDQASVFSVNPDDRVIYPTQTTIKLSKYDGPNENALVNDNCGGNSMLYYANNAVFNTALYHYQDFNIPGFSEFWLHGSDYLTALPILLQRFSVDCQDEVQKLNISLMIEPKNDFLTIDYSADGVKWSEIFQEKVTPQFGIYQNFTFDIKRQRDGYYRLMSIDKDGSKNSIETIYQKCSSNEILVETYPNPAKDQMMVELNYPEWTNTTITIQILDITAKVVTQVQTPLSGTNINIPISISDYESGTYLVKITDAQQNQWILKQLIIQ